MKNSVLYCLLLVLLPGLACKKYEDGPALSLRTPEKRLTAGLWDPVKVLVNGKEVSPMGAGYWNYPNSIHISSSVVFKKDDNFVGFSSASIKPYASHTGIWVLIEDNSKIRITLTDTLVNGQPLTFEWKILSLFYKRKYPIVHLGERKPDDIKVKESALWVEEQRGNDVVEFHFAMRYVFQ